MTFSPGKKLPHSIFLAKLHGLGAGFGVEAPTLCAGCGRSAADRGIGFLRSFVPFLSQLLYQCRLPSTRCADAGGDLCHALVRELRNYLS